MQTFIRIRDPRFENNEQKDRVVKTLDSLSGKTMAILNNGWTAMNEIAGLLGARMQQAYGVAKVVSFAVPSASAAEKSVIDEAVRTADFAVVGLAN